MKGLSLNNQDEIVFLITESDWKIMESARGALQLPSKKDEIQWSTVGAVTRKKYI